MAACLAFGNEWCSLLGQSQLTGQGWKTSLRSLSSSLIVAVLVTTLRVWQHSGSLLQKVSRWVQVKGWCQACLANCIYNYTSTNSHLSISLETSYCLFLSSGGGLKFCRVNLIFLDFSLIADSGLSIFFGQVNQFPYSRVLCTSNSVWLLLFLLIPPSVWTVLGKTEK